MSESEEALLRRAAWVARKSSWWLGEKSPVSEDLAEPLAAWLDDTADNIRGRWNVGALAPPNHITSALIVARALLGEPALTAPEGDDHQEGK